MESLAENMQHTELNKDDVVVGIAADVVMLSEASITNGAGHDEQNLEFLEEEILQSDPMADLETDNVDISPKKTDSSITKSITEPDDDEDMEQEEAPATRTPTQVPKKRRDAALLAAAADEFEEEVLEAEYDEADVIAEANPDADADEDGDEDLEKDATEEGAQYDLICRTSSPSAVAADQPTSSTRGSSSGADPSVDENQCRICTTKDDLISLFKKVEKHTVAELLMIICPAVSIARKDFMPQYICNTCLDNVTIAVQLKSQCEETDKELRKKLSRSKNKVRRPMGYVVIDAPIESDPPSEEELKDDIEFKVSDVEVSASGDEDTSDDSDFNIVSTKRRRSTRGGGRGGGRGRRRSAVTPTPKPKERKRMGRPPRKINNDSTAEEDGGEIALPVKKKKLKLSNEKDPIDKTIEYPCDECEQVFNRKLSLVLHKKSHSGGREPINCEICGKQFKIQGAYRSHLEKHKDDLTTTHTCSKCSRPFMSKADLRRHIVEVHEDLGAYFTCEICKRVFTTHPRLVRHQERCQGYEVKTRKADFENIGVGKDLFKSVAPLTTTYWSDSFSD